MNATPNSIKALTTLAALAVGSAFTADVRLHRPATPEASAINPAVMSGNHGLATFDGSFNYGGSSGFFEFLSDGGRGSGTTSPSALLAVVTGVEFAAWPVHRLDEAMTTTTGGLSSPAEYDLKTTYTSDRKVIPGAGTWVGMAPVALFGAWLVRRQFAAKA